MWWSCAGNCTKLAAALRSGDGFLALQGIHAHRDRPAEIRSRAMVLGRQKALAISGRGCVGSDTKLLCMHFCCRTGSTPRHPDTLFLLRWGSKGPPLSMQFGRHGMACRPGRSALIAKDAWVRLCLRLNLARRAPANASGVPFDLSQGGVERGMWPATYVGHGMAIGIDRELMGGVLPDAPH